MAHDAGAAAHWCWTWNAAADDADDWAAAVDAPVALFDAGSMGYLVYQVEKGEHVHLQGYVALLKKKRLRQVVKLLGGHVHVERTRGTPAQAADYCKKADSRLAGPWEWGTAPDSRGLKSPTALAVDAVLAGTPLTTVALAHPMAWVRSYRGLASLAAAMAAPTPATQYKPCSTTVLWGPTRTGKTKAAMTSLCKDGRLPFMLPMGGGFWFDGYQGQDTLVIDDFYGQIKFSDLLNVLDDQVHQYPVKGGFIYSAWTRVFITSNSHPDDWWHESRGSIPAASMAAMMARLSEITLMGS